MTLAISRYKGSAFRAPTIQRDGPSSDAIDDPINDVIKHTVVLEGERLYDRGFAMPQWSQPVFLGSYFARHVGHVIFGLGGKSQPQ